MTKRGENYVDTPFVALVREWLWQQSKPPQTTLLPTHFAELLGLPRSTVHNWLVNGARPDPDSLVTIASRTAAYAAANGGGGGLPLAVLFEAVGYPLPANPPQGVWDFLFAQIEWLPNTSRREVAEWLMEARKIYASSSKSEESV